MSYISEYIRKCPALGWQGGPTYKTRIVSMATGGERRNADQARPRHAFTIPFRAIRMEDYANIKEMHLKCMGMLNAFKFRDHLDHTAANANFGVGDGVTTKFQLGKQSVISGVPYRRDCFVILPDAVTTVNGVTTAGTIDADRGTVTFAAAPANGAVLRWTGEFDLWVRFNQDDLPFSIDNRSPKHGALINGTVDLIEVPPPPL